MSIPTPPTAHMPAVTPPEDRHYVAACAALNQPTEREVVVAIAERIQLAETNTREQVLNRFRELEDQRRNLARARAEIAARYARAGNFTAAANEYRWAATLDDQAGAVRSVLDLYV